MTIGSQWRVNGRKASARDLAEALALTRQHIAKTAKAMREAAGRDADARAVARAIRRAERDLSRRQFSIRCRPGPVSGRRKGTVRLRSFETMLGLTHPLRHRAGGGRASSFHLKFTGRGLGSRRRAKDRPYTRGEAVRAIRYILREAAREKEDSKAISNISTDPDAIASVFAALEELEVNGGRSNANVYTMIVVSLPHELDAVGRERLITNICEPFATRGLPFAAIPHRPDPEGDARNFHAHIALSWRPFEALGDGEYGISGATRADLNCAEFITEFRAHVATVMNDAMVAAGQARRFTPLSRAARGEQPPRTDQSKSSAGRKHHERRDDNIDKGEVELAWINEAIALRAALGEIAVKILVRDTDARQERLARLQQAEGLLAKPVVVPSAERHQNASGDAILDMGKQRERDGAVDDQIGSPNPGRTETSSLTPSKPSVSHAKVDATLADVPEIGPGEREGGERLAANETPEEPVSGPLVPTVGMEKITPPFPSPSTRSRIVVGGQAPSKQAAKKVHKEEAAEIPKSVGDQTSNGPLMVDEQADKRRSRRPIHGDQFRTAVRPERDDRASPPLAPAVASTALAAPPDRHDPVDRMGLLRSGSEAALGKAPVNVAASTHSAKRDDVRPVLKEIVGFCRGSPEYRLAHQAERDAIDALLQRPLNLIANRRVAVVQGLGGLELWVDPRSPGHAAKAAEAFERLAAHPLGHQLLLSVASNLDTDQSRLIASGTLKLMPFRTDNLAEQLEHRWVKNDRGRT